MSGSAPSKLHPFSQDDSSGDFSHLDMLNMAVSYDDDEFSNISGSDGPVTTQRKRMESDSDACSFPNNRAGNSSSCGDESDAEPTQKKKKTESQSHKNEEVAAEVKVQNKARREPLAEEYRRASWHIVYGNMLSGVTCEVSACGIPGAPLSIAHFHAAHIVPRDQLSARTKTKEGPNIHKTRDVIDYLVPSCMYCNQSMGQKNLLDFMGANGCARPALKPLVLKLYTKQIPPPQRRRFYKWGEDLQLVRFIAVKYFTQDHETYKDWLRLSKAEVANLAWSSFEAGEKQS